MKGEAHYNAKLTDGQVRKIRELYSQGFSLKVIAHNYKVTAWNIRCIVDRKSWKDL